MITMRPYQEGQVGGIRDAFIAKKRSVLLVSPTGSGKGAVISYVVTKAASKVIGGVNGRVLVLAHRREIINQLVTKLDKYGVDLGVIMAKHPRHRPHAQVQVASVQTLARRLANGVSYGDFTLVVIDEGHHTNANTYLLILKTFPRAKVIGTTATPIRGDGKGLGDVFDSLVQTVSIAELVEAHWLVPVNGFSYDSPDFSKFRARPGHDYSEHQREEMVRKVVLSGSVINDYIRDASGRRAIAFAVNVAHSKALVEQARAAGIPAEHVDESTDPDVREALLGPNGRLSRGEVMFVSNVGIATEGTDIPAIECVILANPSDSVGLLLQEIGRGLRPWCFTCGDAPNSTCRAAQHRVKTDCRLHDHAGVFVGRRAADILDALFDPAFRWDLEGSALRYGGEGRGGRMTRKCKRCKAVVMFDPNMRSCPSCGATFEQGEVVTVHEDETAKRLSIDELRSRRPPGLRELSDDEMVKVHNATREQKIAEYLRLVRVREQKQLKDGWIAHAFRDVFGHWPRFNDVELASVQPAARPFLPPPPRTP